MMAGVRGRQYLDCTMDMLHRLVKHHHESDVMLMPRNSTVVALIMSSLATNF